jgi:hypothetical protein
MTAGVFEKRGDSGSPPSALPHMISKYINILSFLKTKRNSFSDFFPQRIS